MLTLDPDAAVLLAVDATRGMLDAHLRGRCVETPAAQADAAPELAPGSTPEAPLAQLALAESAACRPWRASEAKRAYLSTLPPPPAGEPERTCDRWA